MMTDEGRNLHAAVSLAGVLVASIVAHRIIDDDWRSNYVAQARRIGNALLMVRRFGKMTPDTEISTAPGSWLLELADKFCRKTTIVLVQQMVADMRVEHFELLKNRRVTKARWVKVLHYVSMARALTVDRLISQAIKYFIGIVRKP